MGYMGLDCICSSDKASNLAHDALDAMIAVLRNGLGYQANAFNTSGPENVGLFFEELIIPWSNPSICMNNLYALARSTSEALGTKITEAEQAEWDDEDNKQMHVKAYRRLKDKIDHWLSQPGT